MCLITNFCQAQNLPQVLSRQNLKDAFYRWGPRTSQKRCPTCPAPKYGYDITADTLIALVAEDLGENLIITPDNRVIKKPATKIELYTPFSSVSETETNYTWKGKTIYTQKFLINWASPSIVLMTGIDYMYYQKMIDVSLDANLREKRYVAFLEGSIVLDPITNQITAYRPPLTVGHSAQKAEIIIQYTKQ